jgi:hypothetical protein
VNVTSGNVNMTRINNSQYAKTYPFGVPKSKRPHVLDSKRFRTARRQGSIGAKCIAARTLARIDKGSELTRSQELAKSETKYTNTPLSSRHYDSPSIQHKHIQLHPLSQPFRKEVILKYSRLALERTILLPLLVETTIRGRNEEIVNVQPSYHKSMAR